jgi:hypothetical protein
MAPHHCSYSETSIDDRRIFYTPPIVAWRTMLRTPHVSSSGLGQVNLNLNPQWNNEDFETSVHDWLLSINM